MRQSFERMIMENLLKIKSPNRYNYLLGQDIRIPAVPPGLTYHYNTPS